MKYKKDFDTFQKNYIARYQGAIKMREYLSSLPGKSILDIGCGSGLDIEFIDSKNPKSIAGLDTSAELITITKERVPHADIRLGDFNYLPWGNAVFDIVWSKYALQHATDINTPLQEIYRILKVNGTVLLQVTHPMRTAGMLQSKNYFETGTNINYPTVDKKIITEPHHTLAEWLNAIIQTGFTIEKVEEIINRPIHEYKGLISPSALVFILKK
jgi:ubiquinone/menaquinone biosynthesis C-methylase UbiE